MYYFWIQVFSKENGKVRFLLYLLLVASLSTWLSIHYHTPQNLPPIFFDFSCPNSMPPCEAKINEQKQIDFKRGVNDVVRDSHRLGKLSEIYQSVIRFHAYITNETRSYISVPSTKVSVSKSTDVMCGEINFKYNTSRIIEKDFILSDSSELLFNKVADFIKTCTYYYNNDSLEDLEGNKIEIPPNEILVLEVGPNFSPSLRADYKSWIIVFIFNLLIILGILPIAREGTRFIKKQKNYFIE